MASLHRDPRGRSPYFYAAFILPDGRRAFRSTKRTKRKEAEEVARGWERAARLGRAGTLSEVQARDVLNDIYERANGERMDFLGTAEYLREWLNSKDLIRAKGTVRRYRMSWRHSSRTLRTNPSGLCPPLLRVIFRHSAT